MSICDEILATMDFFDESMGPLNADLIKACIIESIEDIDRRESSIESAKLIRKFERRMSAQSVESQIKPDIAPISSHDELYENILKNKSVDWIEKYFVRTALKEIPKCIVRLRQIDKLRVKFPPGKEIEHYFEQACRCYVYGVFDAVAIMSRSVLEFGLNEILACHKKEPIARRNVGHIEQLINTAIFYKIIKKDHIRIAHRIRQIGNRALHKTHISEFEARQCIRDTVVLLTAIYAKFPCGRPDR